MTRRAILFAAGRLTLAAAAVSPLHEAGESSFTLHMVEHELLMLVAAPLLALSRPLEMLWAWPAAARKVLHRWTHSSVVQGSWNSLSGPVFATVLQPPRSGCGMGQYYSSWPWPTMAGISLSTCRF